MTDQNDTKTLQRIRKTYSRTVVIAGTLMGFTACTYCFTLGVLIDGGYTAMLWLGFVSAILLIIGLIYLKPLSLFITRILLSMNSDSRRVLKSLTVAEIEKAPQ